MPSLTAVVSRPTTSAYPDPRIPELGRVRAVVIRGVTTALGLQLLSSEELDKPIAKRQIEVAWASPPPAAVRALICVCRSWVELGIVMSVALSSGETTVNPALDSAAELDRFSASYRAAPS